MINSESFWAVLLASVLVYWLLPLRLRCGFLAFASLGWIASQQAIHTCALLAWSLLFFYAAPKIPRRGPAPLLILLVLAIVAYLAAFKYVPPIVQAILGDSEVLVFALPLGISYFTFKLLDYIIEYSHGHVQDRSLSSFLCYMFLLPMFTAGPIERYEHFLAHQTPRDLRGNLISGFTRITYGLIKKLVLAELLADLIVRHGIPSPFTAGFESASAAQAWLYCIVTYLFVYLDFSAYTDIAVGGSRLFGIRIMENFRWPVLAHNIGNFWKRWHISLSGWCQSSIYLPCLAVTRNAYVAVLATFLTIGLWHAGTLSYVFWGLYHAFGVAVFYKWTLIKRRRRWNFLDGGGWRFVGVAPTFLFVASSFAFTSMQDEGARAGWLLWCKLWGVG